MILARTAAAAALAWATASQPALAQADAARRSGLDTMGPALQAMQRDDSQNPGMLWVQDGATLWRTPAGAAAKACADCHGEARRSMAGVAARHPAWDAGAGRAFSLGQRIARCQAQQQLLAPGGAGADAALLALTAYVAHQSRGHPITPAPGPGMDALRAQGQALWQQRIGQLNLACMHCHDQRAGQRLGGSLIPQGHATGYPIYRLEWQGLGTLQRRLRGCVSGVRAEPWAPDAPEWLALEAWLMQRAAGMPIETPAVRP